MAGGPGLSGELDAFTRPVPGGRQEHQCLTRCDNRCQEPQGYRLRETGPAFAGFEMEKEAMGQGVQGASRS